MAVEIVFAALDDAIQLLRLQGHSTGDRRGRTSYQLLIKRRSDTIAVYHELTRDHLVALHYALVQELARQNIGGLPAAERARLRYNRRYGIP